MARFGDSPRTCATHRRLTASSICIAVASGNSALALVIERLWAEGASLNARMEELFASRGRKRDNIAEHPAVSMPLRRKDAAGRGA
jgi:hypothetical protein